MRSKFHAYELAKNLYQECKPLQGSSLLKDQLDRASLSIVLNLAEGSAKSSRKDRKRFFEMALGSARETCALVELLEAKEVLNLANYTAACVYRLVVSLRE